MPNAIMQITARKDPARPEIIQGVDNMSFNGGKEMMLFTINQLKAEYIKEPAKNPINAKEMSSFVLEKDKVSHLYMLLGPFSAPSVVGRVGNPSLSF